MRTAVRPGEIRARGLGRLFEVRVVRNRSLKAAILRRDVPVRRELWALEDIDLDISRGEAFGIVGRNGSGKSTLLKLIARIFAPTTGTLEIGGRVGSLIEIGAGFHPEFTGVENVYLNGAIYGLSRSYVDEHLDEIIGFAELEAFADMPVKTYSSGMFMRLGFSVAMHVQPDILLLDEILAVGDESFQQKCFGKIWDFRRAGGTIVFVSHDPSTVERLCDRAILLEAGRIAEEGPADEVVRAYHRRLTHEQTEMAPPSPQDGARPAAVRVQDLRAVAAGGEPRDRFMEGEPLALELELYSESGAHAAQVTIGLREDSGHPLGSQTTSVDLRPATLELLRLHFPGLPLREGRFFVDVRVMSHDGDAELALAERALLLTVFAQDGSSSGTMRLGGSWELPSATRHGVAPGARR
ncbi:MAG: polysaccharide ABC transporter ATP-binding protein [Actinomycetota bacterium]|nr:polysaccharide ABC transporter ATP-binding protein [Actinomycetota bacterium]